MVNVYFFQISKITKDGVLLDQVKIRGIFFSYFQVDKKYYLFLYDKKLIEIDFFATTTNFIKKLDSKKRAIRSLRGFLLYALEIMENGQQCNILSTNLSPFFWKEAKNVIRQNRKGALEEFLFKSHSNQLTYEDSLQAKWEKKIQSLEEKIQSLEKQFTKLQLKNESRDDVQRDQSLGFLTVNGGTGSIAVN